MVFILKEPGRSLLSEELVQVGAAGRKQTLGINRGQETACEETGGAQHLGL